MHDPAAERSANDPLRKQIDQHQLFHRLRLLACSPDSDPRAHGVSEQGIFFESERGSEGHDIGCAGVERVVEMRPAFRQTAPAHVENVDVECRAQPFRHERP